ncbi:prefoldin subunit beta [Candidatus Woesearchaeota archaeon]|nr:prefoldin subunit beta [Candidatus Woesearchaeota archaeon]
MSEKQKTKTEAPKKDMQEKINKLSAMEQSLQSFLSQKQAFQAQLMELASALEELGKTDKAYRIVGNVMVSSDKASLIKDLEQKKETMEIRIKSIEKQEAKMREKTSELQSEVMKEMSE